MDNVLVGAAIQGGVSILIGVVVHSNDVPGLDLCAASRPVGAAAKFQNERDQADMQRFFVLLYAGISALLAGLIIASRWRRALRLAVSAAAAHVLRLLSYRVISLVPLGGWCASCGTTKCISGA